MSASCPRCGAEVGSLVPVDGGLRQRLVLAGVAESLPPAICGSCLSDLEAMVGKGSVLLAQEKVKEERKMGLWKTRVSLLKKARNCVAQKAYAEAAVAYEKYLKVIEVVFDTPAEKLTPEVFKDRAATKELTVLASLYWDLLRIYDSNEKYRGRQIIAAQKLAQFLPYTPVSGDIIRKAEQFKRSAKNPDIVGDFLKSATRRKSACFIATAAFESTDGYQLSELRIFRDFYLAKTYAGRRFIKWYYQKSPSIAEFLNSNPRLKPLVRWVLEQVIRIIRLFK